MYETTGKSCEKDTKEQKENEAQE